MTQSAGGLKGLREVFVFDELQMGLIEINDHDNNMTMRSYPGNNYLFKVKNKNTRKRCKICLKLSRKTPERRYYFYCLL